MDIKNIATSDKCSFKLAMRLLDLHPKERPHSTASFINLTLIRSISFFIVKDNVSKAVHDAQIDLERLPIDK